MPATIPCLWFDGQAKEAGDFYVSVFPNARVVDTTYYPAGATGPDGSVFPEGKVLTVEVDLDGTRYTLLDGGPEFTFNEAISFQIMCDGQAEVDRYWDALTAGGGEPGPCGWLKDKYGISWQVVPAEWIEMTKTCTPAQNAAMFKELMTQGKIDLAALKAAADNA